MPVIKRDTTDLTCLTLYRDHGDYFDQQRSAPLQNEFMGGGNASQAVALINSETGPTTGQANILLPFANCRQARHVGIASGPGRNSAEWSSRRYHASSRYRRDANVRSWLWVQPIDATHALNRSETIRRLAQTDPSSHSQVVGGGFKHTALVLQPSPCFLTMLYGPEPYNSSTNSSLGGLGRRGQFRGYTDNIVNILSIGPTK